MLAPLPIRRPVASADAAGVRVGEGVVGLGLRQNTAPIVDTASQADRVGGAAQFANSDGDGADARIVSPSPGCCRG